MTILPSASPFPAPVGLPASQATLNPAFGVNPFTSRNMFLPSAVPALPDIAARRERQLLLMQQAQTAAMSMMSGVDLPDTTGWTPDQAATQTDQALAKIATVNPDLAEQLASQRSGEGNDGGLFGAFKSVIGGGLSVFGKVLDVISRPAYIIPNLAFDLADGGDFNAWHDVGGALAGDVKHNWNSVFQELGWEGGGFGGFLRATLGLGADILTDPLTWVIPTGAGVHVGEAAAQGAEKLVTRSAGFLATAREVFGEGSEQVLQGHLDDLFKQVSVGAAKESWKWGDDAVERGQALVGRYVADGQRELAADMFEAANRMYGVLGSRSARSFVGGSEGMVLSSGRTIAGSEFKELAEATIRAGAGTARRSPEWASARAMASIVGGTRAKLALPFTSFRYISPAIPGTWGFTLDNFGRFFAGQSGMKKLVGAISSGKHGASWDDLTTWMQGGWKALKTENPDLASVLSGRLTNLGSMHYAASEAMGGLTAHFSKGAKAWRAGYLGYLAHGEATAIKQVVDKFLHDIHSIDVDGKRLTRENFLREVESTLGLSLRQSRNTATDGQLLTFSRYLDYFPFDMATDNPRAIEDWFWDHGSTYISEQSTAISNREIRASGDQALIERADAKLAQLQEVAAAVTPQQRTVLQRMGRIWEQARTESGKKDAVLQDVKMAFEDAGRLHPLQVRHWQGEGMNPGVAGKWFFTPKDQQGAAFLKTHGITADDVAPGDYGTGIQLHISKGGTERAASNGSEAAVRGRHFAVIDRTTGATTNDEALVLAAREQVTGPAKAAQEAIAANSEYPVEGLVRDLADDKAISDGIAETLKAQGYEGVIVKNADGSMDATIFDWANVKSVDETAPQLVAQRGYFHRTFTKEADEFVRGVLKREGRTVLVDAPRLQSDLRRETFGMTIDEAEDHVRAQLARRYGIDPAKLPKRIWNANPLDVHQDYLSWAATGIASEMAGAAFERYSLLGDLAPGLMSRGVRSQVFDWILAPAMVRALQQTNKRTSDAVQVLLERSARVLEHQQADHLETSERIGALQADIEQALAAGQDVPSRLVNAIRKWGSSVADAQEKLSAHRVKLLGQRDEQAELLRRYDAARAAVEADPLFGHPGKGQPVKYIDHEDGTSTAYGWHGRIDAVSPEGAYEGVDPAAMSNAGFHFGTYDQAKARIDTLVGTTEALKRDGTIGTRTIGHRGDPSTWPTIEGPSAGVNPVRGPGESLASHTARITDDRQFPVDELTGIEVDQFGAMARQMAEGVKPSPAVAQRAALNDEELNPHVLLENVETYFEWKLGVGDHTATRNGVIDEEDIAQYVDDLGGDPEAWLARMKDKVDELPDSELKTTLKGWLEDPSRANKVMKFYNASIDEAYEGLGKDAPKDFGSLTEAFQRAGVGGEGSSSAKVESWLNRLHREAWTSTHDPETQAAIREMFDFAQRNGLDNPSAVVPENLRSEMDRLARRVKELQDQEATRLQGTGSRNTDMAALRASVAENGVSTPITIRVDGNGDWQLLEGKHRLDAADAEGIDTVPVRWEDEDGNAIPAPTTTAPPIPVEPDLFYEDVLFPVEVRGRFAGRGEGETVLSEGDEGFDRIFSGSGAGRTAPKAEAVERWEADGYDGIIYANDVENADWVAKAKGDTPDAPPTGADAELQNSIVVFRPDGKVFEANAAREFDRRAAAGELYIDDAGSVYTKAGHWANGGRFKRVYDRESLVDGQDAIERALAEDEYLMEALRRGIPGEMEDAFADAEAGVELADAMASYAVEGAKGAARRAAEAAGSTGEAVAAAVERAANIAARRGRRERELTYYAQNAMKEANRAYAEYKGVRAELKPALVKTDVGDLRGFTRMGIPGLEGYALPDFMASEFHSMVEQYGVGELRQAWRRYVLGPWKRWATYRWPGFHVRNFFGAWFNNWLGGVGDREYTFAWRVMRGGEGVEKWAGRAVDVKEFDAYNLARHFGPKARGKVTYGDVAETMADQGINHANVMVVYGIDGAVDATRESFRAVGKSAPRRARRAARKYDDAMRYAGSSIEDFHRTAAWARGMASTNGDLIGSRAFVMMRHGDYSELTAAEDFIRDLVPFYKWMRTNVPYQIRMLAENPGQVTLIADKAKNWAYDAQGVDRAEAELQQPGWMKQGLSVPIPSWVPGIGSQGPDALKFAMFDMPYADLYNGLQDYMSSGLPVVRNVLESYGTKSTWFSGKPLTGNYEKLNGVFALPGVSHILRAAGLAKEGADGELYIQDKMQNVLMAWPVYSRFRNFVSGDADRASSRLGGLFSMIGGVGIREGDYTAAELDFFYNEVQPLLDQYRTLGIQLPTMDDIQSGEVGAVLGLVQPDQEDVDLETLYPQGLVASAPQTAAA